MTHTSNKQASILTSTRKPFKGSNTFAEWHGCVYAVYSYGYHFPLFVFDSIGKKWYGNSDKYSRTTSKHYSQLSPHAELTKAKTSELQAIIAAAKV
jgi:hypothetical protein